MQEAAWPRSGTLGKTADAPGPKPPLNPAGELTSGAKATHDQLLEWLNLQDAQFGRLAGSNGTAAGGNATAAAATGALVAADAAGAVSTSSLCPAAPSAARIGCCTMHSLQRPCSIGTRHEAAFTHASVLLQRPSRRRWSSAQRRRRWLLPRLRRRRSRGRPQDPIGCRRSRSCSGSWTCRRRATRRTTGRGQQEAARRRCSR